MSSTGGQDRNHRSRAARPRTAPVAAHPARPARVGDVVDLESGRLEVLEMTGRRIDGVRLRIEPRHSD